MATKFIPPTLDEWMFYADSIGWMPREDAEAAYDHYLACGWRIGSKPMCDWQAAARNCKRRSVARQGQFGCGDARPNIRKASWA